MDFLRWKWWNSPKMLLLLLLSMDFNSDWFILWIQSLLTILLREISKLSILGKYGLFGVKTVKFTKNASSPSGISGIQFWSIYFVDPANFHNSSSQNFKIFNFGKNMDFLRWKQWNSPKMLLLLQLSMEFNFDWFIL